VPKALVLEWGWAGQSYQHNSPARNIYLHLQHNKTNCQPITSGKICAQDVVKSGLCVSERAI
jgi:hypothetical protein